MGIRSENVLETAMLRHVVDYEILFTDADINVLYKYRNPSCTFGGLCSI